MKFQRLVEKKDRVLFVAVDLQARLLNAMEHSERVIKNSNILIESSRIFDIPLIVTEQYPKGLGSTDSRINVNKDNDTIIEKIDFSVFQEAKFLEALAKYPTRDIIVLFGIETHVCIYQSALDLRFSKDNKYYVYLIEDACSSRASTNHHRAIKRMEKLKINIESTEMILFQLLENAATLEFKQISKLIK